MNGRRRFSNRFIWIFIGGMPLIYAALFSGGDSRKAGDSFADLIRYGKSYFVRGEYEKARQSFRQAMEIDAGQKNPDDEVDGLIKLALISWNLDSVAEAKTYFLRGRELAEKSGDQRNSRHCQTALAAIQFYEDGKRLYEEGQSQLSVRSFKHALLLAESIGSDDLTQKCLRSASVAAYLAADYDYHYALARKSLAYAQRLGLKREMCLCLYGIGANFFKRGNYTEALKNIELNLGILRELREPALEADCYSLIGLVFSRLGDYGRAHFYGIKEKDAYIKSGELDSIHITYTNIGRNLARQSLDNNDRQGVKDGISILQYAIELARDRKDALIEAISLNNIGYYCYRIGEYDLALSHLRRAYEVAELEKKDKGSAAVKKYALSNMAMIALALGNAKKAYAVFDRLAEEEAGELFQRSLWEVYYGLGLCEEEFGNDGAALSYYEKATDLIEEAKAQISVDFYRASYQRDKLMVYERILGLYFKKYKAKALPADLLRLFMAVERVKAKTFMESLLEKKNEPGDNAMEQVSAGFPPSNGRAVIQSRLALKAKGQNAGSRDIFEELKEAEDVEVRGLLSRKSRSQQQRVSTAIEVGLVSRLQEFMPDERMAILEYYLGKESSFLFLITAKDLKLFELPSAEVIKESLKAVAKKLAEAEAGIWSYQKALARLSGELLFPLQDPALAAVDTLIIIPDGFLFYVPFEAAIIDLSGKPAFAVERYRISYAPSSTSLLYLLQQDSRIERRKEFLAVGNPATAPSAKDGVSEIHSRLWSDFFFSGRPVFDSLPFSQAETLDLAGLFPSGSVDLLLGEEAKERTVKLIALDDYRIIHFACHALLDPESAFRSALLLAPDKEGEEDGFLQVSEIYSLKMDADLVVLSACQTARGILQRGEGVFGLSRTFFHAGARAVLSTLWPVNDKASSVFMKCFYGYLVEGRSKSEALRLAKLDMIRSKYAQPAYWAAYVLNGDYRAIFPR